MSETGRKPRQRRDGTQQAEDIVVALRRARVTFIEEGDEVMAEMMQLMGKDLDGHLKKPKTVPAD